MRGQRNMATTCLIKMVSFIVLGDGLYCFEFICLLLLAANELAILVLIVDLMSWRNETSKLAHLTWLIGRPDLTELN